MLPPQPLRHVHRRAQGPPLNAGREEVQEGEAGHEAPGLEAGGWPLPRQELKRLQALLRQVDVLHGEKTGAQGVRPPSSGDHLGRMGRRVHQVGQGPRCQEHELGALVVGQHAQERFHSGLDREARHLVLAGHGEQLAQLREGLKLHTHVSGGAQPGQGALRLGGQLVVALHEEAPVRPAREARFAHQLR